MPVPVLPLPLVYFGRSPLPLSVLSHSLPPLSLAPSIFLALRAVLHYFFLRSTTPPPRVTLSHPLRRSAAAAAATPENSPPLLYHRVMLLLPHVFLAVGSTYVRAYRTHARTCTREAVEQKKHTLCLSNIGSYVATFSLRSFSCLLTAFSSLLSLSLSPFLFCLLLRKRSLLPFFLAVSSGLCTPLLRFDPAIILSCDDASPTVLLLIGQRESLWRINLQFN